MIALFKVMYPKIRLTEDNIAVTVVGAHPAGTKYTGKFGYLLLFFYIQRADDSGWQISLQV